MCTYMCIYKRVCRNETIIESLPINRINGRWASRVYSNLSYHFIRNLFIIIKIDGKNNIFFNIVHGISIQRQLKYRYIFICKHYYRRMRRCEKVMYSHSDEKEKFV